MLGAHTQVVKNDVEKSNERERGGNPWKLSACLYHLSSKMMEIEGGSLGI
jgi:hypothetical protein